MRQSSVIMSRALIAFRVISSGSFWGAAAPAGATGVEERAKLVVGQPGEARDLKRIEVDDPSVLAVLDPQARAVREDVYLDRDRGELAGQLEAPAVAVVLGRSAHEASQASPPSAWRAREPSLNDGPSRASTATDTPRSG